MGRQCLETDEPERAVASDPHTKARYDQTSTADRGEC